MNSEEAGVYMVVLSEEDRHTVNVRCWFSKIATHLFHHSSDLLCVFNGLYAVSNPKSRTIGNEYVDDTQSVR